MESINQECEKFLAIVAHALNEHKGKEDLNKTIRELTHFAGCLNGLLFRNLNPVCHAHFINLIISKAINYQAILNSPGVMGNVTLQ